MAKIEDVLKPEEPRPPKQGRTMRVSPETHTRLIKIKEDLGLKSIDAVMNRLLDRAEGKG